LTASPITDEQALTRLKAFKKHGSIKAASEATGIGRQALRHGIEIAKQRGLDEKVEEDDLVFPSFPTDDLPVEKLIDHMVERSKLRKQSYEAHTWFPVKVKENKPIGILWFGDPHLDDNGCDWELIKHHARLCKETPGLYGANIGDSSNNWGSRLAHLYANQDTSVKTARRFVEWFMLDSGIKWLIFLLGNHDVWGDGAEIMAQMALKHKSQKVPLHDWEARFVLQFPNGEGIRINAAHDFAGSSMWNPLHGAVKTAKHGDHIDLAVCGHLHNWAISQWEMAAQGNIPVMLRVKGYKTYDKYAQRLGHYEQKEGSAILTVLNPHAKTRAGRVVPFADVDAGAEFLTWLRSRS
jgi:hypothetical protein